MRIKTTGNALLIFAFLLTVAGIVEPSSGVCAAAAVMVFAGFLIVTVTSHNDWSAGYRAAQLDMTFSYDEDNDLESVGLFKCGRDDCDCKSDPMYREFAQ